MTVGSGKYGEKDRFVRENGRIRSVETQARSHKRERLAINRE